VKTDDRPTTDAAIQMFLTSLRQDGRCGVDALAAHERQLARLQSFCERGGHYFPAEITTALMLKYRATWNDLYPSDMTRKLVQHRLRRFLKFCFNEGWIARLPQLSTIHADPQEANPLEPEQFDAALAAAPKAFSGEKADLVRGVMLLMRFSGLAVADATTLERAKLIQKNGRYLVETNRRKTGTSVSVPIPPNVAGEILALAKGDRYLFWDGRSSWRSASTSMLGHIKTVFKKAFGEDTEFSSHNLRDTAGCEWLKAGIPLEIVSEMLGHKSVTTTERHYKKLVQSLKDRHADVVAATWEAVQQ
jgi:integrase